MQISIIMSVYNGEAFVRDAISSLVFQTFSGFELIIIDDGSNDQTPQIIDAFAKQDPRIRIFRNTRSLGICYSLNKAISLANCELIARMDADDISLPTRLEKQLALFQSDPDLVIAGSAIELIDDKGEIIGHRSYPKMHEDIIAAMADYSPFCHPSVMFRKQAVIKAGGYREHYRDAEDYDLWLRLKDQGRLANIQEHLLQYRIHPGQVTVTKLKNQHRLHMAIRKEHLGLKDHPIWHKLKGKPGSLGSKYMTLAYQQNQLGQRQQAVTLAAYALLHSPLSAKPWRFFFGQFRRTHLYNNYLWYRNKLRGYLGF